MSKTTYETEFKLKVLRSKAIPAALDRAERYRLLNEPAQAESICLDILEADPGNQQALILLLLSLTDQFSDPHCFRRAAALGPRLTDGYHRAYYEGIFYERESASVPEANSVAGRASAHARRRCRCGHCRV